MNLIFLLQNIILENKKYTKIAVYIALVSMAVGAAVFYFEPGIVQYILSLFEDKFGPDPKLGWNLVIEIFKNNVIACMVAMFGGAIFGLIPIFVLIFNFFAIGIIGAFFLIDMPMGFGLRLIFLLVALLPHGIIELPVILLSCALGIRLGWRWMLKENKGKRGFVFKEDFVLALKAAPILIVLLFIAAIIEVFGTGKLLEWLTPRIMGV